MYFPTMFSFAPIPPPFGTCFQGAALHPKSLLVLLWQQDEIQVLSTTQGPFPHRPDSLAGSTLAMQLPRLLL